MTYCSLIAPSSDTLDLKPAAMGNLHSSRVQDPSGAPQEALGPLDGTNDEPVDDEVTASGPAFSVLVRTLGSDQELLVTDLRPAHRVSELCEKAAALMNLSAFTVKLCIGTETFEANTAFTLQAVGIADGTEVMLLKRAPYRAIKPGVSTWNASYVCTVERVEEVGIGECRLEFCVVGDMTAGRLQEPTSSTLTWGEDAGPSWGAHGVPSNTSLRPHRFECDHRDIEYKMAGTLFFKHLPVPPPEELRFTFGEFGYSSLKIHLEPAGSE